MFEIKSQTLNTKNKNIIEINLMNIKEDSKRFKIKIFYIKEIQLSDLSFFFD